MAMGRCLAAWRIGHDEGDQALSFDAWNGVLEDGLGLLRLMGMRNRCVQRHRREYCGDETRSPHPSHALVRRSGVRHGGLLWKSRRPLEPVSTPDGAPT